MPFLEVSTKLRHSTEFDRGEALEISNLRPEELDEILAIVLEIDELIQEEVAVEALFTWMVRRNLP